MADTTEKSSLERLLRPLRQGLNKELAELLLSIQADDGVQTRYYDLADRNTEGRLSQAEQDELALIVQVNAFLTVLKAEARAFLHHVYTG
jgi:RNA processing factor Prp31